MSSAARIEELQKKFDENPRRYFAPLANECRKAGELDAAIAICRAHLPQQPGHMSGHIVYGQALYEAGEIAEARTVFETALGLDPENLIALRHMGDIAARDGDIAAARQWYRRVLETDPRNEEIQALVAGLGPDGGAVPGDAIVEGLPVLIDPELMAVAADASDESESPFAGSDSLLVPTSLGDSADHAPADGFSLDGFEATSFDAPADGLSLDGFEATSFDAPAEATGEHVPPAPPADTPADAPVEALAEAPDEIELEFYDREVPRAESSEALPAEPPEPDAFVTETMAELYLRQGYRDEAIGVYRQLVAQNPDDERLRARLASAELDLADSAPAGEEAGQADAYEMISGLPDALEPELLAAAADAALETEPHAFEVVAEPAAGPTIREFLAALAQGRPVAVLAAPVDVTDMGREDQDYVPEPLEPGEVADVIDVAAAVEAADWTPPMTGGAGDVVGERLSDLDSDLTEIEAPPPAAGLGGASPGLDGLFGNVGQSDDNAAADVLARAYSPEPDANVSGAGSAPLPDAPADPLSGRPARPAGNDLSLDSVFGTPRQPGGNRNPGGFSFDQFFAEGAVKTPREESPEPSAAGDGDEDLEQFNSWLHGLKNK